MSDSAPAVFDRHAGHYDAQRRRLIPLFDVFYDTAVAALALAAEPPRRILDLGAGTGLLAQRIAEARPAAELVLLDASAPMLDQARAALGDRAAYVEGDFTGPLPAGPWDAIVSALAIHHIDDPAKRDLLGRVHDALAPGGMFVNAEQVAGPSALFDDAYGAWHRERALAAGLTEEEWALTLDRMSVDRPVSVGRQLGWLREAGFADADCLFKDHRFAVLAARRSG